jgi:hypothetical protein
MDERGQLAQAQSLKAADDEVLHCFDVVEGLGLDGRELGKLCGTEIRDDLTQAAMLLIAEPGKS